MSNESYTSKMIYGGAIEGLVEEAKKLSEVTGEYALAAKPNPPTKIIYSTDTKGAIGEARDFQDLVHIYLDAKFWPDRIRDGKEGLQFLGEYTSFTAFKMTGSFDELTLKEVKPVGDFMGHDNVWGIWP